MLTQHITETENKMMNTGKIAKIEKSRGGYHKEAKYYLETV